MIVVVVNCSDCNDYSDCNDCSDCGECSNCCVFSDSLNNYE